MEAVRALQSGPRRIGGGHSARYEARRAARGSARSYAPEWSDAAAAAVYKALEDASELSTGSRRVSLKHVAKVIASAAGCRALLAYAGGMLSVADRALAAEIVAFHQQVVGSIASPYSSCC